MSEGKKYVITETAESYNAESKKHSLEAGRQMQHGLPKRCLAGLTPCHHPPHQRRMTDYENVEQILFC